MRKAIQSGSFILLILCLFISIISCNKELSQTGSSGTSGPTTSATSTTIAVTTDSAGTDSVYFLQTCDRGYFRDSISSSALPDTITNYLATSYSGYKFYKAYEIKED